MSGQEAAPWLLPVIDTTTWIGNEPPARRWVVEGWLARGTGALLVGEDGIGKSLVAQQLATCVAAGKPFLGLQTTQVPALYVTCEDDATELWRRQRSINSAVGVPRDAAPAMLSSLVGYVDVCLGGFGGDGAFELSPAFHGIAARAKALGVGLLILDNVAHLFAGNENARRDVASFCAALDRLAIEIDATVLILAHPNKSGAEYSGSTGWSAHVRQRWFMERPEGEVPDRDARVIRKSKANYSAAGEEVAFRWHQWAFVRDADMPRDVAAEMSSAIAAAHDNGVFLACLDERNRQERAVSENKASRTYAPKEFAAMAESKKIGRARLEAAMDRLFRIGEIERGFLWRDAGEGKDRYGLRRASADPARASADLSADVPLTPSADVPLTARRPPLTHTLYTTYISGAAEWPAAPNDDPEDWTSEAAE